LIKNPLEGAKGYQERIRRKFIGILFDCCGVYQRVYINRDKTAYIGWCPKCARRAEVKIGPDGVDTRFFIAR
jgi:hypothetical protein